MRAPEGGGWNSTASGRRYLFGAAALPLPGLYTDRVTLYRRSPVLLLAAVAVLAGAGPGLLAPAPVAGAATSTSPAATAQEAPARADEAVSTFAAARHRLAAGDPAGAIALLEPLAADPATPPSAITFLGGLYVETERYEDALALFESRPGGLAEADAETLFVAARAARGGGHRARAEALLARSAALAPQSRAAVLLAGLRTAQERHTEAAELLAGIVNGDAFAITAERDPAFAAEIALHYAHTLVALDRRAEAVPALERAVGLTPDNIAAWRLLGETLIDLDRVNEAHAAMQRVRGLEEAAHGAEVERAERREEARELVEAAVAAAAAGRADEALAGLREAAELSPGDPAPGMLEVRLLVSLDRHDEALARADELVAAQPGSADLHHLRGMVHYSVGDAAAEADLRRAVELAPEHREARTGLALALVEQGELDEAEALLDAVLAEAPGDDLARRAKARLEQVRRRSMR